MSKTQKNLLIVAGLAVVAYYAYTQYQKKNNSNAAGFIREH